MKTDSAKLRTYKFGVNVSGLCLPFEKAGRSFSIDYDETNLWIGVPSPGWRELPPENHATRWIQSTVGVDPIVAIKPIALLVIVHLDPADVGGVDGVDRARKLQVRLQDYFRQTLGYFQAGDEIGSAIPLQRLMDPFPIFEYEGDGLFSGTARVVLPPSTGLKLSSSEWQACIDWMHNGKEAPIEFKLQVYARDAVKKGDVMNAVIFSAIAMEAACVQLLEYRLRKHVPEDGLRDLAKIPFTSYIGKKLGPWLFGDSTWQKYILPAKGRFMLLYQLRNNAVHTGRVDLDGISVESLVSASRLLVEIVDLLVRSDVHRLRFSLDSLLRSARKG
ncbi:MAG: hypothetical protein AAF270_05840 [Pseudomonadota bacterium]